MTMPRVTILMPVHNGASYLREAIESILAQTFRDFEFLIVDDASEDNSAAIVQSVSDPRIRLVRSDNRLRLSGALNLGLKKAAGDLIARMDADDICLPSRIEEQVAHMDSHPKLGVSGTWVKVFGANRDGIERYPESSQEVRAHSLFNTPFAHPTVMLRRKLFLKHSLTYDVTYYPTEDFELWERALRLFPGDNMPRALLRYRVHEHSMTGNDWSEMDRQASRVSARRLTDLGFEPVDEVVRFHRKVATATVEVSVLDICRAEDWLKSILAANDTKNLFERDALAEVVAEIWLRACMHTTGLGWWLVRKYATSTLSRRASGTWLCACSVLKAAVNRK